MWLINAHYYWLARVDLSENYSKLWCFIMVYHQHAPSENSYILRDNLHFDPFWDIATSHIVGYMYSFTFIFSLTSHWTPIVWWLIPWYPYDIICHGQSNENTMKIPFNPTKSSFSLWPHGSSHQKKFSARFSGPGHGPPRSSVSAAHVLFPDPGIPLTTTQARSEAAPSRSIGTWEKREHHAYAHYCDL